MVWGSFCALSLTSALAAACTDKRAERLAKQQNLIPNEPIKMTDIRFFPWTFWLICAIRMLFYATVFPFVTTGPSFFQEKYGVTQSEANRFVSLPFFD